MNNIYRFTALLAFLLPLLPLRALYYDPNGVENPLDSDITENVRYVTYICGDARLAEKKSEIEWQSMTIPLTVIYCEDGTVYLKRFLDKISSIIESRGCIKYWIKGRLSDDGRHIDIPVAQMIATDGLMTPRYFYPFTLSSSGNESTVAIDESVDTISLRIEEDGTLVPLGVDNTHGWGCYYPEAHFLNTDVLFCDAFVPTETQPILPPPGLVKEDYDFKFAPAGSSRVGFGDVGKRVKMVSLNDTVFIQGISYLENEGWSVGRKEGDTYVFADGRQPSSNITLKAVKFEFINTNPYGSHVHYAEVYSPIDTDVVFDIDPTSNTISTHTDFWLYGSMGKMVFEDYTASGIIASWDNDIYIHSVFKKIPDGLQHPLPPDIKIVEKSGGNSEITVSGSYFDSNGYVMDRKKLFYRLYIDGEPYVFTRIDKWFSFELAEPAELLPYYLLNGSIDSKDTPRQYEFSVTVPTGFREVRAELVYIQDGQEVSSGSGAGVNTIYGDSESYHGGEAVYDLTGRKVNPDSLLPGIYIKGGQKFIVR